MNLLFDNCISAVLITGGISRNTAELFLPSDGTSCTLPPLPQTRQYHTVDNHLLCGGWGTDDSCLKWNPDTGTWEEYLTLHVDRGYHVSWTPDNGIGTYLMGGFAQSSISSTLVKPDGTQETGFPLVDPGWAW